MSAELERINKIADVIDRNTSIKDKEKIMKIAQVVDEFSLFILQIYLENKKEAEK